MEEEKEIKKPVEPKGTGIQIIRAFKDEFGHTKLYNFTGNPITGAPVYPLKAVFISRTITKYVDKKPEKKI